MQLAAGTEEGYEDYLDDSNTSNGFVELIPFDLEFETGHFFSKNTDFFNALRDDPYKKIVLFESNDQFYSLIYFLDTKGLEHIIPLPVFTQALSSGSESDMNTLLRRFGIQKFATVERLAYGETFTEAYKNFLENISQGVEIDWTNENLFIAQQCLLKLGGGNELDYSKDNKTQGEDLLARIFEKSSDPLENLREIEEKRNEDKHVREQKNDLYDQDNIEIDSDFLFWQAQTVAELATLFPESTIFEVEQVGLLSHDDGILYTHTLDNKKLKVEVDNWNWIGNNKKSLLTNFIEQQKTSELNNLTELFIELHLFDKMEAHLPKYSSEYTVSTDARGELIFQLGNYIGEKEELTTSEKIYLLQKILNIPILKKSA